jgi:hypothetical protein
VDVVAEGVGFEPTEAQKTSTVFETVPFVRSGSLPVGTLSAQTGCVYEHTVSSAGAARSMR